jgi:uncharacterized repeat protein (TIGR01451 family)
MSQTSGTRIFAVKVNASLAAQVSQILNTAAVTFTVKPLDGPDVTPANNTAADTTSVNRAPAAQNDSAALILGGGATPVAVLANDSDLDNDPLTITAVSSPAHGTAVIQGSQVLYTPQAGFIGGDSLTYTISDGRATATATITLQVAGVDLRVSKSDGGLGRVMAGDVITWTLAYTSSGTQAAQNVTLREVVPAHTTFHAAASSAGWSCADGAAAGSACTLSLGTVPTQTSDARVFAVQVTNPPAEVGVITNTVQITHDPAQGPDATPANNTATDTTSVNRTPVAQDDAVSVLNGSLANALNVRANDSDADGDALTVVGVTAPAHGTAATNGTHVVYTPTVGYTGSDSLSYTVSDGMATATASVALSVTGSPLVVQVTSMPPAGTLVTPTTQIAYTITVRNGAGSAYSNLRVEAELPAETVLKSADKGCAAAVPQPDTQQTLVWTAATLASQETCIVRFTVVVSETALGTEVVQRTHASVTQLDGEISAAAPLFGPPVVTRHPLLASHVEVTEFNARRLGTGTDATVAWVTGMEQNLEGFVILRGTETTPLAPITELIPAANAPHDYEHLDSGLDSLTQYEYWLEVHYEDGRTVRVGPRIAQVVIFLPNMFGPTLALSN